MHACGGKVLRMARTARRPAFASVTNRALAAGSAETPHMEARVIQIPKLQGRQTRIVTSLFYLT